MGALAALVAASPVGCTSPQGPPSGLYIPADCSSLVSPPTTAVPTPSTGAALTTGIQLRIFDQLVGTVGRDYVYPDFHGTDWPAIAAGYRSQIAAGINTEMFYADMEAVMVALGDKHSNFLTPDQVAQTRAVAAGELDYVGVGVATVPIPADNRLTITRVVPGSSAAHAGLQPHDSILAINGRPVATSGVFNTLPPRGPRCSVETLSIESPGAAAHQSSLVLDTVKGPALIDTRLVHTTDGSRVAYIFLPTFLDATIPGQVAEAIKKLGRIDGLILDTRMNSGGSEQVLIATLGYFTEGVVGTLVGRTSTQTIRIESNPDPVSANTPMAVLIGPHTFSAAEVFAGILKDQGRASLIGARTAGLVQSLHVVQFEDGSEARLAEGRLDPAVSHADWATTGIVPDLEVDAEWDTYTFHDDPGVAAALKIFGRR